MKSFTVTICLALLAILWVQGEETNAIKAHRLKKAVVQAHGGESFSSVNELHFSFHIVENGLIQFSARHEWNLKNDSNTVRWDGKSVAVNLKSEELEGDEREAFNRWVNDSYWLLAPLKLNDRGTTVTYKGSEEIEGRLYEVLHVSFSQDGLAMDDQYDFYVDPQSYVLRYWNYFPHSGEPRWATWEDYQKVKGLLLPTKHQVDTNKFIWFSDFEVK